MNALRFFALLGDVNLRILRRRIVALREQSFLMLSVIVLFVASYWIGGYILFKVGFTTLVEFPGLRVILLDRMLYLFFAFLFMMLVFSNMIIGYASLFKSAETQWMLTLPVRHTDVFRWKLAETTVLASWAFVFLSAPLMLAYGSARQVSGWFYLKVFLLFLPFIMIPSAFGSLLILLLTRFLKRRIFKWALFGLGAAATFCVLVLLKPSDIGKIQETQLLTALNQLLRNSQVSVHPMLPSYWLASSVIAFGDGWAGKGMFFFMVLASNALMATLICVTASGRMFYDGWSHNHSQGVARPSSRLFQSSITTRCSLLEDVVSRFSGLHHATRALVVKDIKTFCRDTSQWSQFGIFFGLLGLYVLNLRNVAYDWKNEFWAAFVSFLNLGASSMTLATLTTRFVFPQFSLEGKRLWIVGMTPDGFRRVLLEKFWLSSLGSAAITLTLIVISSWMPRVPGWLALLFGGTVILMSFALCSIAVGIGALFPNFGKGAAINHRDDNPAKIVSGFGGTFCFILSLLYIVLVIGAEALPMYVRFAAPGSDKQVYAIVGSWLFVSVISLVAISVPMTLALQRVEQMEI